MQRVISDFATDVNTRTDHKNPGATPGGFLHGPGFNDQRNLDLARVSSDTIGPAETEEFWRTFLRELLAEV